MTEMVKIGTGVPGLDGVLDGGLVRGGVYLVEGPPGAGKTILANQMAFHIAASGGRAVYVTLLGESHERMFMHLTRMRFFHPELIPERLAYLGGFRAVEAEGLAALGRLIKAELAKAAEQFVVIDGFLVAERSTASENDLRKFFEELQSLSALHRSTVLILTNSERGSGLRPEQTLVDGIVLLSAARTHLRMLRHLEITKLRGSAPLTGMHTLEINDDGITIYPRIEVNATPAAVDRPASVSRVAFGLPRLDKMFNGGLPEESITMVAGPSGSGKTILGLQFLSEGAGRGEQGLHFGFYEKPATLLRKAARIRIDLSGAADRGLLSILWQPPVEGVLDVVVDRLLTEVRRHRPRRLVLDGIHGIHAADGGLSRLMDVFPALLEKLEAHGVTTLYTMETTDLFGPTLNLPFGDLSAMTHNIIILRHVELDARLRRLISILKVRESGYDSAIREFRITDKGILVSDTFRSAEHILSGAARVSSAVAARPSSGAPKARIRGKKG